MVLLQVDRLRVRRGRRVVLDRVDLGVDSGEVVALLGPNGAGKSTLLAAISGLLPVASGQIRCTGRIGSVLQTPGLAQRSVRANVELALAWWGVPRSERRERAMAALALMRVDHLARRPAASLSGGEQRRVHVARGLAVRADLLLLDEPFAGLDPETREAVCADAAAALRQSAGGVLVVVHERAEAWALADRLAVIMDGRLAASGEPGALLAEPPTAEVARFLGYDGELRGDGSLTLTRPPHVKIDPAGDLEARVSRVTPQQDGMRVELALANGTLRAWSPDLGLRIDDQVRVRLVGGKQFDTA